MSCRRLSFLKSVSDDSLTPPTKRLKSSESADFEEPDDQPLNGTDFVISELYASEIHDSEEEPLSEAEDGFKAQRPTELESALAPVRTDKEAIAEYDAMWAAEDVPEDLKTRLKERRWGKGKSSIYVDAFNLCLETVLSDESHLFDEKEIRVFGQWRELDYESQYL